MNRIRKYTDAELVKGCIANDRRFQEATYRQFFPKMLSMSMRYTSDRETAMEIVNNGFLRAFKKMDTFSFKGSLEGWVRKLVFHSVSDYFRKNNKYGELIIFEEKDTSSAAQVVNKLFMDDLLKMVHSLSPTTQKVFTLYAIEGYNHREIGEELGMSDGTSKWHLSEARKKLKQMLKLYNYENKYERI